MSMLRQTLHRLEINRAVLCNLLLQGWSALAGPVTILIITHWLSAEQQGFFYTFTSVLALQAFVELGLGTVIVQTASHEWAFLRQGDDGRIEGQPAALSRLASLLRFAMRWYAGCALLVTAGLGIGGSLFFRGALQQDIAWFSPWITLCLLAGLGLLTTPIVTLLEGCNQVTAIYTFRLIQGMLNSLALLLSIMLGAGLFALAIAACVRLLCSIVFAGWQYRRFLLQLLTHSITERIDWQHEVFPFQWRLGVSWLAGYLVYSLFTPVMFHFHGAVVAGQMGMTLAVVATISSLAYSWVQTRIPQFGMLIAQREFTVLDRLFRRLALISLSIALLGSLCVGILVVWLQDSGLPVAGRVLAVWPTILLLVAGLLNIILNLLAFYLRAHKREPLMWSSLVSGLLIGGGVVLLGMHFGPMGAAAAYLAMLLCWSLPISLIIFRRCRKAWHQAPAASGSRSMGLAY